VEHITFDHDAYVNSIPSIPGRQFLIPSGTIHSSGRNQVVLEIGSKVMGSYTFKQYDYVRLDLNGTPRPIHTLYGSQVLLQERNADFVMKHLCKDPVLVEKGATWEEYLVGEDDLVYFSCRQVRFSDYAEQNTHKTRFHGLVLVDGEQVTVRSKSNPDDCYHMKYLDVVIVPSDMGEYVISNDDPIKQPVVVYKVQVKE
jgi:mannose-6-phosphate isomerase class I